MYLTLLSIIAFRSCLHVYGDAHSSYPRHFSPGALMIVSGAGHIRRGVFSGIELRLALFGCLARYESYRVVIDEGRKADKHLEQPPRFTSHFV